MCGIVGALAFKGSSFEVTEPYLVAMRDAMVHRGPDGCGVWVAPDRRLGLGHRRLAIIDLSEAALQPMSNEDDTVWITFNGEIYNHLELRAELLALGHRFKTDHADTEVILHGFEEWGIDVLGKLRGMYAFALWDTRERTLWLARDRLGVKPLYYSAHNGRLTFASEIKALLRDPQQKRAVNEEAFFHYLSYLTTPAPETLFEGIRKIPCGCVLKVDERGEIFERRYWDVWDHTEPLTGATEEEVCERLLCELREAVTLRKIADVPVGCFLSGGIDSSTNAQLFGEGEGGRVKTFTIGYDGQYGSYQNELEYARIASQHAGTEHHELLLTIDDLMRFLPKMIHLQDEPIADPVCFPLYAVSKLARDNGVVVCQVGEGADELFCGYKRWGVLVKLAQMSGWPVPRVFRQAMVGLLDLVGKRETAPREWVRRSADGLPIVWSGTEAFTSTGKDALLSPRLRKEWKGRSSWEAVKPTWDRYQEKAWEKSPQNWMAYADLNLRLPELLLMRVDKMSMGVSLEARVPFLDHKFVEFAMSIPSALKTKGGQLKYPLRQAVRGVIPDALIDRAKQGFGVPVYEWLFDRLGERARRETDALCANSDLFDADAVRKVLNSPSKGNDHWVLLNVAMWWRHNLCGESFDV
ncbi:MAG: asparagine synthase (glutamine-hydrolyzing) [Fimbriimonadaceae bacterium]|nr:asparagine synthase (glutamine-hydrolyzing) [Fimbriimonadaceae bacterium]